MIKLFILILFVVYVYYVFRKRRKIKKYNHNSQLEELVKCENCNVYTPKYRSIEYKNLFFCSKKCKKEYIEKGRRRET